MLLTCLRAASRLTLVSAVLQTYEEPGDVLLALRAAGLGGGEARWVVGEGRGVERVAERREKREEGTNSCWTGWKGGWMGWEGEDRGLERVIQRKRTKREKGRRER